MSITHRIGPALLGGTPATTKYTVPTGRRAIVRHVHFNNPSLVAVNFTWSIGADAAGVRIEDALPIASKGNYHNYGPYTMEAGEVIQAFESTPNAGVLTIDVEETLLT